MGLLQPLPIPDSSVAAGVAGPHHAAASLSQSGNDAIVVFVDKLTKMVHYVATTTNVTAPQLATLFMREVVRLHGVPESILSDRDPRFTAHFWRAFWTQLGTTLTMSTAYHPQTDGQTERANRTLEEMLRARVNFAQTDWDEHLAAAELAINNAKQASTGFSPFYLNYGQEVQLPLDQAIAGLRPSNNPEAAERIRRLQCRPRSCSHQHRAAQQRQAHYADQHRRAVTFNVGDRVLLSTEHLKLDRRRSSAHPSSRTSTSVRSRSSVSSTPTRTSSTCRRTLQIHPVLNISRLKPYRDGRAASRLVRRRTRVRHLRPFSRSGAEVYEVESIIAKRGSGARAQYLVKWRGYPLLGIHLGAGIRAQRRRNAIADYEAESWRTTTQSKRGRM